MNMAVVAVMILMDGCGRGEYDYDMEAKDAAEMAAKLKRDGLTTKVTGQLTEAEKKKDPPIGKPKRGGSGGKNVYIGSS